jgi:acyl-CoA synthetase (NDP forming)
VLVGLGGVLTEVLDDVVIRLAPIDRADANTMLQSVRGRAVLDGVRGRPAVDADAVARVIVRLGAFIIDRPDVMEVDLNPVVAHPAGATIVDALIVTAAMS